MIEEFKNHIVNKYEINDMEMLRHFLGIDIYQEKNNIFISKKVMWTKF